MAAVLGIVRGHRAAIRIGSRRGEGTTFRVLFPIRDGAAPPVAVGRKGASPGHEAPGGRRTILFVDDDKDIRKMAKAILGNAGFHVLLAEDGREALDVLGAHADDVACVILDLTMPRLDGEGVIVALRERGSRIPILLSSGYSEDEITRRFADGGLAGFIQKPYPMDELIAKVRQVIQA
ncbi:response regulator [bacterium]|nr:response regulator [bacterium]